MIGRRFDRGSELSSPLPSPRLSCARRAPALATMVHRERQEKSNDSDVLEVNLNDLIPPELAAAHSNSSGSRRASVYGGVAPTEPGNALTNNSFRVDSPHSAHSDRTMLPPLRHSHEAHRSSQPVPPPSTSQQPYHAQSRHSLPLVPPGAQYPPSFPAPPRFPEQHRSIQVGGIVPSDLPAFSRWSPTWVSGGYSGDGRAFTEHPPPPTARAESAWGGEGAQPYPYLESQDRYARREGDEEEEGGWVEEGGKNEWEGTGGEYRHGVGFDHPASDKDKRKVKERMRRLEREFGERKGVGGGGWEGLSMKERMKKVKEEQRKEKADLVERSGVDSRGRLVVMGRRKRVALRWLQGFGALGVGIGSIGSALVRAFLSLRYSCSLADSFLRTQFTKPETTPPPAASAPLYILYLLPFLSLILTLYLFIFRPCTHRNPPTTSPNQFVVPLLQGSHPSALSSSGCCCLGSDRKKGKMRAQQQHATTVNLVVDPSMFPHLMNGPTPRSSTDKRRRKKRRSRRVDKEEDPSDSSSSSSSDSSDAWSFHESSNPRDPHQQRKGILSAVHLEGRWRDARAWVRKIACWDFAAGLCWAAAGGYAIGFGERCTPGAFGGWW